MAVTDRAGFASPILSYGKGGRHHGGYLVAAGINTLDIAPGTWQLGCSDGDYTDEALRGEVTIIDQDRNFRDSDIRTECVPRGMFYASGGEGKTEQEALADVVKGTRSTTRVRLYSAGYWQRPGHRYVIRRSTGEFLYGSTYPYEDGSGWHAGLDGTCQPV